MRAALLIGLSLALASCGGSPDDHVSPEAGGPASADTVVSTPAEAISRAQRIDEGLALPAASTRSLEIPGEEPRTLRLWRENDVPEKLLASEGEVSGRVPEHTSFYFSQGELFLVMDPRARYVFDRGRLTVILDDQLDTLTVRPDLLEVQEQELRERVVEYLAVFGED